MLEKGESFEGLEIGDIDFSGRQFKNHVNFYRAKFIGTVNYSHARFFNGANFNKAEFSEKGGANFSEVVFSGKVEAGFRHVQFTGEGGADFRYAKFSGEESANFSAATFSGKAGAIFGHAKFIGNGGAKFTEATFSGEGGADFSFAEFSGEGGASFSFAQFTGEGGAFFGDAKFSGEGGANFKSAVISATKGLKFTDAEFLNEYRISFEDVTFEKDCIINFDNVIVKNPNNLFFRNAYLGNTSFYLTDIEEFNFKNVKFRKFPANELNWLRKIFAIRRYGLMDELEVIYDLENDTPVSDEHHYSNVEILYRQLKRNFEEKRDYARAGDFHYGEMEMKRLQQSKFKQYISLTAFYKYFSGYGQKWRRALFWFSSFVVLFTYLNLNWLHPIQESKSNSNLQRNSKIEETDSLVTKFDSFLYTFNTMTLRKDTRFEITAPIGSVIVIFQTLIGPTMLALMLLAIRRQFRR